MRQHRIAQHAQFVAHVIGAERLQRDETIDRRAPVAAQAFGEAAEDIGRHALRPVVGDHEFRRGAEHRQCGNALWLFRCRMQGDQPAQRPAAPWRIRHHVEHRIRAGIQGQWHAAIAVVSMARQVDDMQGAMLAQYVHQRREDAAVHRPAVQQYQRRTLADHVHAQAHANTASRACARASSRPSICRVSCAALRVIRKRALPSGTVGGRIGATQ